MVLLRYQQPTRHDILPKNQSHSENFTEMYTRLSKLEKLKITKKGKTFLDKEVGKREKEKSRP